MHDHLWSQTEGSIKPHSFTGQWTIDLIDLNAPGQVEKRQAYLTLKKTTDSAIATLEKQYAKLKTIEKTIDRTKITSVQHDIATVEKDLVQLKKTIKIFGV